MPLKGYRSLTIKEQTAETLQKLAQKENLGIVEYFEKLASELESIKIGSTVKFSVIETAFSRELYPYLLYSSLYLEQSIEKARQEQKQDLLNEISSLGFTVFNIKGYVNSITDQLEHEKLSKKYSGLEKHETSVKKELNKKETLATLITFFLEWLDKFGEAYLRLKPIIEKDTNYSIVIEAINPLVNKLLNEATSFKEYFTLKSP